MSSKLHIETKCSIEDDSGDQPVSPASEYFNSKALTVVNLFVLEFEVPFVASCMLPFMQDVFLPINPRFSSVMVSCKGVKRWEKVEVNVGDHLIIPRFPEGLTLSEYDVHFDEYLTKVGMEPFPENKPMWEMHAIEYPTSKGAGSLIVKLHHSLGDGYTMMGVLFSSLQRADDPSLPLSFPSVRRKPEATKKGSRNILNVISLVPRTLRFIYDGMCDFGWSLSKFTWKTDEQTPIRSGSQGVGFHPAVKISTVDFSLDKFKQIKTKLGVTINAVLTGTVFLGARLYMQETGKCFRNSKSTVSVPFNMRSITGYTPVKEMRKPDSKMWGNQITSLHIDLPKLTDHNYSNPLDFVSEAHQIMIRMKTSPSVFLIELFLEIIRKCQGSETAAEYLKRELTNSSLLFTSLMGPIEKMALANHPVKGVYFTTTGIHMSLMISAMSYVQTLKLIIASEIGFIDAQKFTTSMEKAFDMIYVAAMSDTK